MIAVDFFQRFPASLQERPKILSAISSALLAIAGLGALFITLKYSRTAAVFPLLANGVFTCTISTPARLYATFWITLLAFWGFFKVVRISPLPKDFSSLPRELQDWCVEGGASLESMVKRCQFALQRETLSEDFIKFISSKDENWKEKWKKLPADARLWCYEKSWESINILFVWLELPESIRMNCTQAKMGEARLQNFFEAFAFLSVPQDLQDYFRHFPAALQIWGEVPKKMKQQCFRQTSGPAKIAFMAFIMLSIPTDAELLHDWCQVACPIIAADWKRLKPSEKKWCIEGKSLEIRLNRYLSCFPSEFRALLSDQREILLSSWSALSEKYRDYFFEEDQLSDLLTAQEFFHLPQSIHTWCLEGEDQDQRFAFAMEIALTVREKRRELACPDGLGSLPDLREITHLKKVILNQPAPSIFEKMDHLGAIRELEIYSARAPSLKGISDLPSLETLYLEDCEIEALEGIETLTHLRTLSLTRLQRAKTLPPLGALKSLQSLLLIQTSINQLPDLGGLKNLNTLSIINTPIFSLPGGNKLWNLEELILKNTGMFFFPQAISNLRNLRWVKLGKEFGSPEWLGGLTLTQEQDDIDLYTFPGTWSLEVSMQKVTQSPDLILDWWMKLTPRPSVIRLLDEKGNLSEGVGKGVDRQFYAVLSRHLFQKGKLFTKFYGHLPSARNLELQSSKWSLSRVGAFLSYLYRWRFLTGKILPETFFGILQILKQQSSLERVHSEILDLLLKGEKNSSLRELKAYLEEKPVSETFINACKEVSKEEAILSLQAALEPYLPCLEIAQEILKGISGPLKRDLMLYPYREVSSRLQGFISAKECIATFKRNSDDPQVNQKIDWLEELLYLKEKIGEPVFVEDFISYATGGQSLDEGDIITIGESPDECVRVTTCAKTLSLPKTMQLKKEFFKLMEMLVKDREFSAV